MKLLLDENITVRAKKVLEEYGHDVIHILERCNPGESDEGVFALATEEKRALITLNGKHFIILIPPMKDVSKHYGLIWLRGFQVTKQNYEKVMGVIGHFLATRDNIEDLYYAVRQKDNSFEVAQRYPNYNTYFVQLS